MSIKTVNRKLGTRQVGCLESLLTFGGYPGGWQWTTPGETNNILTTLKQRGYCISRISGGVGITRQGVLALAEAEHGTVWFHGKPYRPSESSWKEFIRQFPLKM